MAMMRFLFGVVLYFAATMPVTAQSPHWSVYQAQRLVAWLDDAPNDGLNSFTARALDVRSRLNRVEAEGALGAVNPSTQAALDQSANDAALDLLAEHRNGCCHMPLRQGWNIQSDQTVPAAQALAKALANNDIDGLYGWTRPNHPNYVALRQAYASESDPRKRALISANMDRWRWMPRNLGQRYILVNAASYQASLWEGGREVERWPVIVGKKRTPTPIFSAQISGVIFNPWWEIPASIVREGVGSRAKSGGASGYVYQNGRYRQRPGPNNALGRMKLVMPNRYAVYLHDTNNHSLFARDARALSHGCIRVSDAPALATELLRGKPGWDRSATDRTIASGRTTQVTLPSPIPVYIAYFTAEPSGTEGQIAAYSDVYGRDHDVMASISVDECCPA